MSRFTTIYEKNYINVFFDGFPVIMQKSRILFDSETDKIVIQFKLENRDTSNIEKVFLKVDLLDSEKNSINTVEEHIILSSAGQGESFGENSPLYENNKSISSCDVVITKVILNGGRTWVNGDNSMCVSVAPTSPIHFSDKAMNLFNAAATKFGIKTDCMFEEHENCWRCSCGTLNSSKKDICFSCGAEINTLRECFSIDNLESHANKSKKKKIITITATILCCIILGVAVRNIIYLNYVGGGKFPEFNKYGIAFINSDIGRDKDVIVNRLGFDVVPDIRGFYQDDVIEGFLCFRTNTGNAGIINDRGKIIVKNFDYIELYSSGFALVEKDDLYGCVNLNTGKFLIKPEYYWQEFKDLPEYIELKEKENNE